jgi:hypothetical protein
MLGEAGGEDGPSTEVRRAQRAKMSVITIVVPLPPRELRRNVHTVARRNPKPGQSARRAIHWSDRSKAAEEYAEQVWIAFLEEDGRHPHGVINIAEAPWPRARVHYRWFSTHQMDQDNIISSMKVGLDTCTTKGRRPLSIIEDDRGVEISAEWVRVAHRKDEKVTIAIEEVRD